MLEYLKNAKSHCIICAIDKLGFVFIPFAPFKVSRHPTVCRLKVGSKYHKQLTSFVLLCQSLLLIWNTYKLFEFCISSERTRCLIEVSDNLNYLVGICGTLPLTLRYKNLIIATNLTADIVEYVKLKNGRNIIKEKLGRKIFIITLSINIGIFVVVGIGFALCFYNTKHANNQTDFIIIIIKYTSLLFQMIIYVFYSYFTFISKAMMEIVNDDFCMELVNVNQRGYDCLYVSVTRYTEQLSRFNKIWMNVNKSIKKFDVICLISYTIICVICSYCFLLNRSVQEYFDVGWCFRTTVLVVSIAFLIFALDHNKLVSFSFKFHFNIVNRINKRNILRSQIFPV